jgi:hypothetical protein
MRLGKFDRTALILLERKMRLISGLAQGDVYE